MIDYPPMLQGSPYLQLQSLRDYLVRMAEQLQTVSAQADSTERALGGQTISGIAKQTEKTVEDNRAALKSLIIKTAAVIESHVESIETELHSDYVAESEFGTYKENAEAKFTATAAGVSEVYDMASSVTAGLDSFKTEIQGEIQRGVIRDPDTGADVIGIAISQKLYFEEGGIPYIDKDSNIWWRLSPSQTFALYTATGWQYWINGSKVGWFTSQDSSLHLTTAYASDGVQFGSDWVWQNDGAGFGLKYNG